MPAVLTAPIAQSTGLRRPSESRVEFSASLIRRAYLVDVEAMARYLIAKAQSGRNEPELREIFLSCWASSGWLDQPYAALVVGFSSHRGAYSSMPENAGQLLSAHTYLWGRIAQEAAWIDIWDKITVLSGLRRNNPDSFAVARLAGETERRAAGAVMPPFGGGGGFASGTPAGARTQRAWPTTTAVSAPYPFTVTAPLQPF